MSVITTVVDNVNHTIKVDVDGEDQPNVNSVYVSRGVDYYSGDVKVSCSVYSKEKTGDVEKIITLVASKDNPASNVANEIRAFMKRD